MPSSRRESNTASWDDPAGMIIRREGTEYVFITQPDHAALARRIMEHCVPLQGHARSASILRAIGEHDNGWAEPDAASVVSVSTGEPLDFIHAPTAVRQGVWPRGVARLSSDPWAAALVAHHAVAVYDRYRGDEEWTAFFTQMESLRDALVSRAEGTPADLLADYRFVRLGDLISLVFCTGWIEPLRHNEWTVSRDGNVVSVAPSPFDTQRIPATIPARRLPLVSYRSNADLHAALAATPAARVQGEIIGRVS
jgi:hypothetical protein